MSLARSISTILRSKSISSTLYNVSRNFSERASYEKSLNQVSLLGRVGTDPQIRGSEQSPVVVFSMATNVRYKQEDDSDEFIQKTDWHRISVFRTSLRKICVDYLKKGTRVLILGKISYGKVADASGSHQTTHIVADEVILLSSSNKTEKQDEYE